jgi:type II secretory pathway pseudopilin PulG
MEAFTVLEILLATAIFSLVVVALAAALNKTIYVANLEKKQTHIRLTLDSKMAEALQEAQQQVITPDQSWKNLDPDEYGIAYEKRILLSNLKNNKGKILSNLYSLTVRSKWLEGNLQEEQSAEMMFYKSQ